MAQSERSRNYCSLTSGESMSSQIEGTDEKPSSETKQYADMSKEAITRSG